MTLFISHSTAAECWRSGLFDPLLFGRFNSIRSKPVGSIEVERASSMLALDRLEVVYEEARAFAPRPHRTASSKPAASDVRALKAGALDFASDPMHLLVSDKTLENRLRNAACHVHARPLPSGSFVRLEEGVLLAAPELSFLLMASCTPFHALVKLGWELCALYTIQPDGRAGYGRALPPTTPEAIATYLERFENVEGIATARKALRHVAVASGSPMETALAIILCLPPRLGGFGLPLPRMNYRVAAPHDRRADFGKSYYLCDLCWPGKGVSVEYDSDREHTGSDRIAQDARRRNDLATLGIATITATREQVTDQAQLDSLAHQIARMLGVRIRAERGWDARERKELFRTLVASSLLEVSWTKSRRFVIPD